MLVSSLYINRLCSYVYIGDGGRPGAELGLPSPPKHLDTFKGAPRRLPKALSDQLPVCVLVSSLYINRLCTSMSIGDGGRPGAQLGGSGTQRERERERERVERERERGGGSEREREVFLYISRSSYMVPLHPNPNLVRLRVPTCI